MGGARPGRYVRRVKRVLVAAGVVGLGLVAGCGGEGGGGPQRSAPACDGVVSDALDPTSVQHLLPGSPEPSYATDPPTSGAHASGDVPGGVQEGPLARPVQVAILEEGGVVVQHRGVAPGERRRLEVLAGDQVVVAPNPDLPAAVVATAWRHRLVCRRVDEQALRSFIAEHRGKGPADG